MKKNWLRNCDFLNVPMSLSYRNEIFYSTNIGAFLTIICFILVIVISSYEIKLLYSKSSFKIISNQYTDLSEKLDFSKNPLLFQLADDRGEVIEIDDKLFKLNAYDIELTIEQVNNARKMKVDTSKLELESCDKVLANRSEYTSYLNLSQYICFKPGQNLTSYGLLGDTTNGFKGFRVEINKCSGSPYCYEHSFVIKKLQNIKFIVTYLSLKANIYNLDSDHITYQLYSKPCSISTNILKKIYFSYNIGRFDLYNNIIFKSKSSFDYITLNSENIDIDLDSSSTITNNINTLAYISFQYSGNVLEVSKEVERLFDTVVMIGNIFNILLTIIRIFNNYYSNKILFTDIFEFFFFDKDIINNSKGNKIYTFNRFKKTNNYIKNKIKNLDISDEIGINKDINKLGIQKKSNKSVILLSDKDNNKNNQIIFEKNKIIYYYFIPYCILQKTKVFNNLCLIKDKISSYFSIEKMSELIRFKTYLELIEKEKKIKMNNTELFHIKHNKINNKFESNSSNKNIN